MDIDGLDHWLVACEGNIVCHGLGQAFGWVIQAKGGCGSRKDCQQSKRWCDLHFGRLFVKFQRSENYGNSLFFQARKSIAIGAKTEMKNQSARKEGRIFGHLLEQSCRIFIINGIAFVGAFKKTGFGPRAFAQSLPYNMAVGLCGCIFLSLLFCHPAIKAGVGL